MLINTVFFFLATQISYLSIIGYGTLLNKKSFENIWLENFVNFFIGLILLNLTGQILYYLNINSEFLNLIIIFVGFIYFFIKGNKDTFFKIIFLNLIFFSGLVISKLHEDWPYHFSFIEQISLHKPIIGIGNVDDIHILSASFFSFVQKLFYLPIYDFKLILIPVYLVYLNIVIFLIQNILKNSKKISQIFIIILTILTIKLARISEFGYDYLSNIILLKILILYLVNEQNKKNNILFKTFYITLFLYAVSIKITALFFSPILIYILISDYLRDKRINFFNSYNLLFYIFLICILFESFLRSGCFIYFLEISCLKNDLISWSIDFHRVNDHSMHIELWAKGFFIQNTIFDASSYLDIKNWFHIWFYNHFFYKIFEFILIPFILLIYFFVQEKIHINNKKYYFLFIASILSILLWLFYLPQLRFGFTNIIVFFISLYLIFLKTDQKIINKKNYFVFIVILMLFFNFKNFNRINNEFKRDDVHKFSNFPFPPEKRIKKSKISNNSIKFLTHNDKTINEYKWFLIIN